MINSHQKFICKNYPDLSFEIRIPPGRQTPITLKQVIDLGQMALKANHEDKKFSEVFTNQLKDPIPSTDTVHFSSSVHFCEASKRMVDFTIEKNEQDLRLDLTLAEQNIQEGDFLECYQYKKLRSQGYLISMEKQKRNGQFHPAPEYHQIGKGTNIEGICKNNSCKLKDKSVVAMAGFREIEFMDNTSEGKFGCPGCGHSIKLLSIIFVECLFSWHGAKWDGYRLIMVQRPQFISRTPIEGYVRHDFQIRAPKIWESLFVYSIDPKYNSCSICGFPVKKDDKIGAEINCFYREDHFIHYSCQILSQSFSDEDCILNSIEKQNSLLLERIKIQIENPFKLINEINISK